MTSARPRVIIYTDGGAKPNPGGPGGWGALLIAGDHRKELSGGEAATTNNRMELTAAIMALEALTQPCTVTLYTDSEYLQKGISEWLVGWVRKGWKTASGQPVKNRELWERLHAAAARHDVDWRWLRGHAGTPENERVDQLATAAREHIANNRH
jgi:ribonuclease HI